MNVSVEVVVELVLLLVYAALAGVLTSLGLLSEYAGLQNALAGDLIMGFWFAWMGIAAIGFGYLLFRDKIVPTSRAIWSRVESATQ